MVAKNTICECGAAGRWYLLAGDKVLFNDMLGSTLGAKDANGFNAVQRTAFGEAGGGIADEFFTGKPKVADLGYAFLFRNYRPEQGKWQTADPMGYPDGWNQLAYVNNGVTSAIDRLGAWKIFKFDYEVPFEFLDPFTNLGILVPYLPTPPGISWLDLLKEWFSDKAYEAILDQQVRIWLNGPNSPNDGYYTEAPPNIPDQYIENLMDAAGIEYSEYGVISEVLKSVTFELIHVPLTNGALLERATQIWEITVRYE